MRTEKYLSGRTQGSETDPGRPLRNLAAIGGKYAERYIILGLKIAYYRKKRGYTQENFAEKVENRLNFPAQVEGTGTVRGVSLETLFKIADVLQLPPAKLLEDD